MSSTSDLQLRPAFIWSSFFFKEIQSLLHTTINVSCQLLTNCYITFQGNDLLSGLYFPYPISFVLQLLT